MTPTSNQNESTLCFQFDPHEESSGLSRKSSFTITMFLSEHGLMPRINPHQRKHVVFLTMMEFGVGIVFKFFNLKKPYEESKIRYASKIFIKYAKLRHA